MSKVPFKNYIYLLLVVLISIGFVYYFYLWFVEYDSNSDYRAVLSDTMQVINDNELDSYLVENKDAIIYCSVTNESKIRQFDKKVKRLVNNYNVGNKILYLDLTNKKAKIVFGKDINIPAVVVYKNGNIIDAYSVRDDNYNIHLLEDYFFEIGVISND